MSGHYIKGEIYGKAMNCLIMRSKFTGVIAAVVVIALAMSALYGCARKKATPKTNQSANVGGESESDVNGTETAELVMLKINSPRMGHVDMIVHSKIPNLGKLEERYKCRPPFMVPKGTTNVALNKKVTTSAKEVIIGKLSMITDGIKQESRNYLPLVELAETGLQYITIDLGAEYNLYAILIWHFYLMNPVYYDVIVQVANEPEFKRDVVTLFNNDHDNSAGMGYGKDKNYVEMPEGKLIDANGNKARYVRLYSNGSCSHEFNHYVEVEVYGKAAE